MEGGDLFSYWDLDAALLESHFELVNCGRRLGGTRNTPLVNAVWLVAECHGLEPEFLLYDDHTLFPGPEDLGNL